MSTAWVKGHGTHNDFVLLPDLDGTSLPDLAADDVRALCDRHSGIGADGVLRVAPTRTVPDVAHLATDAGWAMDYRNADGSLAEMCGNGIRVFVCYLLDLGVLEGRAGAEVPVATRGGVRRVTVEADGRLTVAMGRATRTDTPVTVATAAGPRTATGWHLPNPHAVVPVDDLADAGPLWDPPRVEPADAFPDGVNVEFVVRRGARHLAMRVFERGSGETQSCGTGACAVAVDAMRADGAAPGTPYVVETRGGPLEVTEEADGEVRLTGPAELTLRGTVELPGRR